MFQEQDSSASPEVELPADTFYSPPIASSFLLLASRAFFTLLSVFLLLSFSLSFPSLSLLHFLPLSSHSAYMPLCVCVCVCVCLCVFDLASVFVYLCVCMFEFVRLFLCVCVDVFVFVFSV